MLHLTKSIIPSSLLRLYRKVKNKFDKSTFNINRAYKRQKYYERQLKSKESVSIALIMTSVETWKLDSVYNTFIADDRFSVTVIGSPITNRGEEYKVKEVSKIVTYCHQREYNYLVARTENEASKIASSANLDIVFFTNPNNLSFKQLRIRNFLHVLTCYVPYSFRIDKLYDYSYNNLMVNLTWLNFYESQFHKDLAILHAKNRGKNVCVTGFPYLDVLRGKSNFTSVWNKIDSKNRKRIIWAPHWTIEGFQNTNLDWSCFLEYCNIILNLAVVYKDKVQFAMKPHPFLKLTLYKENLWGKTKTDEYFDKWEQLDNCQVVDDDYEDLFKDSDALIHDSGSFMTEYLCIDKPMAYTINQKNYKTRFNKFGLDVIEAHSVVSTEFEFTNFIIDIILGKDEKKAVRGNVVKKHNLFREGLISREILEQIKKRIE